MTCKDCIHYDVCRIKDIKNPKECNETLEDLNNIVEICGYFKDESKFMKKPCDVGENVYVIDYHETSKYSFYDYKSYYVVGIVDDFTVIIQDGYDEYGQAVYMMLPLSTMCFFSKSKAKEKLKELNENYKF